MPLAKACSVVQPEHHLCAFTQMAKPLTYIVTRIRPELLQPPSLSQQAFGTMVANTSCGARLPGFSPVSVALQLGIWGKLLKLSVPLEYYLQFK